MFRGEMTFVPDGIPRRGRAVLWGAGGADSIELVFPGGTYGVRKRAVPARYLSVGEALEILLGDAVDDASPAAGRAEPASQQVWRAAAVAGVGLIARGRLMPTVTPWHADAWRVGPIEETETRWLDDLAAAFPVAAHPVAIPG